MRYVIASKNEDGVRVFGTFIDRDKAEGLATAVNIKIEAKEDEEFEAWQAQPSEEQGMMPDGYGRVGVLVIHKWSPRRALLFALGELDS